MNFYLPVIIQGRVEFENQKPLKIILGEDYLLSVIFSGF